MRDAARATDFEAVFAEHIAFVWRVLRRHGVPDPELEDASQEVFLILHRKLPEFEGRASLRTFVYAIAARVALGLRRKARVRFETPWLEGTELRLDDTDRPTPFDVAAQREALTAIDEALASLEPEKREVFALYEFEGMTMAEAAQALGLPENTALYRLYAARDEIRAYLRRQSTLKPTVGRRGR